MTSNVVPRGSSASGPRVSKTASKPAVAPAPCPMTRLALDGLPAKRLVDGTRTSDDSFGSDALLSVAIHAARRGPQFDGVAVRKGHLLEGDAKLAASSNPSGPLGFENLPADERAHRNHDAIVARDRIGSLEVDGIAGFGGAGVDAVAKQERDPCADWDGDLSTV